MPVLLSYRNQLTDLHSKSFDWFLYEGSTGTLWVKQSSDLTFTADSNITDY